MFTLHHDGDKIGTTRLERGDPAVHSVSGVFDNVGGAKALAGWIKSIGGAEDEGAVFIVLNEEFALLDSLGNKLQFAEGNLIAVPADDEAYLDLSGVSEADYNTHFAGHRSALDSEE